MRYGLDYLVCEFYSGFVISLSPSLLAKSFVLVAMRYGLLATLSRTGTRRESRSWFYTCMRDASQVVLLLKWYSEVHNYLRARISSLVFNLPI